MDALLHNPIADMYGPDFLLLYGSVIILALLVCGWLIQDPTKNQPLPLIPSEPDPYEIAYLRSGTVEVVKVAILNLIQRGYLQIAEQLISQAPNHDNLSKLQPLEQQVFSSFSSSPAIKSINSIAEKVEPYCQIYGEELDKEQLLYAQKWQASNIQVGLIAATIIFSLGIYKLLIALGKGRHNVGFLIVMGVLSIIAILSFVSKRSRLSLRGEAYLQQLQQTFAEAKTKVKFSIPSAFEYNLVVALFGVEALAGTSYDSYYKVFFPPTYSRTSSRQSSSSNGSCSSSSCSSCSSGSSCSGGSSCGGGGCGGCGGCGGGGD
ncbi:MAG: TIGR04222 domain-containing membrane protein [Aulosira sp. ZfuVER01]|nr:TIGR04222 domain-containing membrane protein [Aulosira sp. ZfuVER01]MDZ8002853.1 TIGR04222 domain-containing membrane protein [Aulosira sp. DedVER01a]MDZ8056535.1 TIGR04222 domain-containing membrane protein [Aulosira sp. ZfuCHP01]